MSFKTYMFWSAMAGKKNTELQEFFDDVALPNQQFTTTLFQDWVFETHDSDVWDTAIRISDYQTLHEFISEFEDKIIDNFLKSASDNVVYIDDKISEEDEMYFRGIICDMYMYIYGEYVNTIFQDFTLVSKRVYQEMFDELDERDEGCDTPLGN